MTDSRSPTMDSPHGDEKLSSHLETSLPAEPEHLAQYPPIPPPPLPPLPGPEICLEMRVEMDVPIEMTTGSERCTVCSVGEKRLFYRPQMALHCLFQTAEQQPPCLTSTPDNPRHGIPAELRMYGTLYSQDNHALWTMTEKDWCSIAFRYHPSDQVVTLTTASSVFSFVWQQLSFSWHVIPHYATSSYELSCFYDDKPVATVANSHFMIWPPESILKQTNPFRSLPARLIANHSSPQSQQGARLTASDMTDHPFTSFVVLSGLIIQDHISSLLKTLGSGPDALRIITSSHLQTNPSYRASIYSQSSLFMLNDGGEDQSVQSVYMDPKSHRRWLAASTDSVEIEPDVCLMRSWPCCGYGGWLDVWKIKFLNWARQRSRRRPGRQRGGSGGGWQQQYY